jgi:hypothetical protein
VGCDMSIRDRRYSVLYQNLLPTITIRWPNAPRASTYALMVRDAGGRTQTFPSSEPTHTITSGQLAEGTYRVWFQGRGGTNPRSPDATLRIAFDNAARTAQIIEPSDGAAAGATVHVAGVALPSSTVTAGGARLSLDGQNRFRGDVPAGSDGTLVIRIAHPVRGVHYYLRRIGPAGP